MHVKPHTVCILQTAYPEGWQRLGEIVMNMPLSVYCQIYRFNYEASCVHTDSGCFTSLCRMHHLFDEGCGA